MTVWSGQTCRHHRLHPDCAMSSARAERLLADLKALENLGENAGGPLTPQAFRTSRQGIVTKCAKWITDSTLTVAAFQSEFAALDKGKKDELLGKCSPIWLGVDLCYGCRGALTLEEHLDSKLCSSDMWSRCASLFWMIFDRTCGPHDDRSGAPAEHDICARGGVRWPREWHAWQSFDAF